MQRIIVFGASGSGKTTLGCWVAKQLEFPFIDLDDVYWNPGWVASTTAKFRAAVDDIARGSHWVIAGNYSQARDLLWPRADTLIWLDIPLLQVLWRTTARAWRQSRSGELICNGNRQALSALIRGPDSLLGYTLRTYHARRLELPNILRLPQHCHARVIHLRHVSEVSAWQKNFQPGKTPVER
ncbi:MAG: shikimate kinase [Burkholderiaceae bacterium]